jgi:hypothetical protein
MSVMNPVKDIMTLSYLLYRMLLIIVFKIAFKMSSQTYDFERVTIILAKIGIVLILMACIFFIVRRLRSKKVTPTSLTTALKQESLQTEGIEGVVGIQGIKALPDSPMAPPPELPIFGRSRSETIAINVFSHLVHAKAHGTLHSWKDIVVGYRPDFLKNPETNRCLEIDAYHPGLKIGIEYNGIQHYKFPNHIHFDTPEGKKAFRDGLARDLLKKDLCKKHGITLIDIPYWIDTCDKKDGEWVYKKTTDSEKWGRIKRYLESKI